MLKTEIASIGYETFAFQVMAIPPALIGAIARNTDWRLTDYDPWVTHN